jgi:PKD repeat protein
MKKFILFFLILSFLGFKAKAQCDAGFTYTTYQTQGWFYAVATYPTAKHTWLFGDGQYAYNQANTVHAYNQPGTYIVTHVIQDSANGCVDSVFKIVRFDTVDSCSVNYISILTNPYTGQYTFHHAMTSPGSPQNISWTVDGVQVSNSLVFNYTFSPGRHAVCVTVQSNSGCTAQYCDSILYQPYVDSCNLSAAFTWQIDSLQGQPYYFTASASGPHLKYLWKFGNSVSWGNRNESRYYFQPGIYPVTLVVVDDSTHCIDSLRQYINVSPPIDSCNLNASFTWQANPSNPQQITLTGAPNNAHYTYQWHFGDNTLGNGRIVTHNYPQQNYYALLLIVTDTLAHCRDSVWGTVRAYQPDSLCTASFTYAINQGQISFTASSNRTNYSQRWFISPMPDSTGNTVTLWTNNPVYTLPGPGLYYVCLRIQTNIGCIAYSCDSIYYDDSTTARIAVIPSYPNPVNTEPTVRFNINLESASLITFKVSSLSGNVVYQAQSQGQQGVNTINIPVQHLGRGQYFIDIMYGNTKKRSVFQKL